MKNDAKKKTTTKKTTTKKTAANTAAKKVVKKPVEKPIRVEVEDKKPFIEEIATQEKPVVKKTKKSNNLICVKDTVAMSVGVILSAIFSIILAYGIPLFLKSVNVIDDKVEIADLGVLLVFIIFIVFALFDFAFVLICSFLKDE